MAFFQPKKKKSEDFPGKEGDQNLNIYCKSVLKNSTKTKCKRIKYGLTDTFMMSEHGQF